MDAATAPDTTAAPPQDANWSAFVNQHAEQQPDAPAADPKWDDLVKSYANPSTPPKPDPSLGELGQRLAQPIMDAAVQHFMPKPSPPPEEEQSDADKSLHAFRNSKEYLGSQQNFTDLVMNSVIKPAVNMYVQNSRAYQQQASMADESLKQSLNPLDTENLDTGEPITSALKRGLMDIPGALIQEVAARTGLSPAIQ